jgi:hypothetical protein
MLRHPVCLVLLCLIACDDPKPPHEVVFPPSATATNPTMPSLTATTSARPSGPKETSDKPRKLRDGERAAIERAFPATARFDFRQSFVVTFGRLGECSFVTEELFATADVDPGPEPAPIDAPSPSVAASAAVSADASGPPSIVPKAPPKAPTTAYKFHVLCKGDKRVTLPDNPDVASWTPDRLSAVSFPDVDGDGQLDIVVIAEYMTGIGPEGAKPFPVVSYYRNANNAFELDAKRSAAATEKGLATVADVLTFLKG